MEKISDRRRYPRISLHHVSVEVYPFDPGNHPSELCLILNLSENGLLFRTDRSYAQEQLLHLTFILSHNYIIITTPAVVVHSTPADGEYYNVGVRFKNLETDDVQLIREFVSIAGAPA
jgi:hypothetical protein